MQSIKAFVSAVLYSVWMIFLAQPAIAQTQVPEARSPQAQFPRPNISDQKLNQAAAAVENVQKVHDSYAQKLASAPPQEKAKISNEATAATMKAVTDQGLSLEEFNSILQLAQNDPNVRDQLVKRLGAPEK